MTTISDFIERTASSHHPLRQSTSTVHNPPSGIRDVHRHFGFQLKQLKSMTVRRCSGLYQSSVSQPPRGHPGGGLQSRGHDMS
ncbi:unnamed protein product [Pleuronectes platessa]|uniref:Uncharacterized protein n=1 Tax=Pleuronectes platessa TaxID=8262 RepID=A0A9N7V714_PLEPL|nr:unnamed protein product [Pleuronectes platessa]